MTVNVVNRSVLPVGHTFVKGVDLLDGHLVQQSTDFKVPGRHLGLEVDPHLLERRLEQPGAARGRLVAQLRRAASSCDGGCGLATVVTPDGGGQVFQSSDGLVTFTPQKGYHTRLDRDGTTSTASPTRPATSTTSSPPAAGRRPRLDFIEEPHGDRLVFTYDGSEPPRSKVAEVQPEAGEVRAVDVHLPADLRRGPHRPGRDRGRSAWPWTTSTTPAAT